MTVARQITALAMTLALLFLAVPSPAMAGYVVERIRANGYVTCGINYLPGFSGINREGVPTGMDVDYCRALAAVLLDNPDAIRLLRVNSRHKFQAVRDGDIDVNFGLTSWGFERETVEKVAFTAATFHDGQAFITWADSGISSLEDVARSSICVQSTINTLTNLESWLGENHQAKLIVSTTSEEKLNAFAERQCLVLTGSVAELSGYRLQNAISPALWKLIPGTIARSSFSPIVSSQDRQWESIVRWVAWTPMLAELYGVTRNDVTKNAPGTGSMSNNQELQRLLGNDPKFGKGLGLPPDWAAKVISTTGNYAEMFDRHMAPLGVERGPNRLWKDGGVIIPPLLN